MAEREHTRHASEQESKRENENGRAKGMGARQGEQRPDERAHAGDQQGSDGRAAGADPDMYGATEAAQSTAGGWGEGQRGEGQIGGAEGQAAGAGQQMQGGQTCRDVMTKMPACCIPDDTAEQVAQVMKTDDVGSLPVIDDPQSRKLIGIVTDRDLAIEIVAESRDPRSTRIADIMTQNPVYCRVDDQVERALQAMAEHQVRRIPVVENGGRVVGIIAQADVATRIHRPEQTASVVEEISRPAP
jgi:CBS domain-containing protein